jgi:hypothetical protein
MGTLPVRDSDQSEKVDNATTAKALLNNPPANQGQSLRANTDIDRTRGPAWSSEHSKLAAHELEARRSWFPSIASTQADWNTAGTLDCFKPPTTWSSGADKDNELRNYDSHAYKPISPEESQPQHRIWAHRQSKDLGDILDTTGELYAGAWTAAKLAPKYSPIVVPKLGAAKTYMTAASKSATIANAFSPVLVSGLVEFGADKILLPEDQKMESTLVADWLITPAVAIAPLRWPVRVGIMLAAHAVGRIIDHFRQGACP